MGPSAGSDLPSWGAKPNAGWGAPIHDSGPGGTAPSTPTSAPLDLDGPVSAPVLWLAVVTVLEVIGTVLGLFSSGTPTLSILGWLVGGFGAIGGLAWFTLQDSARRTSVWYSSTAVPGVLRAVLAGVAIAVVALNAAQFADWASRR